MINVLKMHYFCRCTIFVDFERMNGFYIMSLLVVLVVINEPLETGNTHVNSEH